MHNKMIKIRFTFSRAFASLGTDVYIYLRLDFKIAANELYRSFKPERTSAVANRLIGAALGIRVGPKAGSVGKNSSGSIGNSNRGSNSNNSSWSSDSQTAIRGRGYSSSSSNSSKPLNQFHTSLDTETDSWDS